MSACLKLRDQRPLRIWSAKATGCASSTRKNKKPRPDRDRGEVGWHCTICPPIQPKGQAGINRLEFPTERLSGERGNTHATGFLVKIANPPAVSIMQFALSARLPIIKRPSLAKSDISSPVSFLKSLAEIQTDCPGTRFISSDLSATMLSGLMNRSIRGLLGKSPLE